MKKKCKTHRNVMELEGDFIKAEALLSSEGNTVVASKKKRGKSKNGKDDSTLGEQAAKIPENRDAIYDIFNDIPSALQFICDVCKHKSGRLFARDPPNTGQYACDACRWAEFIPS